MSEKLASAYVEITAKTEEYMRGMSDLKTQALADLKAVSLAVSASAGAAAAAAGAMGMAGLQAFSSFEKGMNEVFTLLPGMTASAKEKMAADVNAMAAEMSVLPSQVIPALYQALSSGVPSDNVFAFLKIAQQAAVGGVTTLAESVKGLASVVNAYGADVIDAGRASDIMFTTVRLGMTTFGELSGSLFNVAPVAASLGVKFEEVAAAMAAITLAGTPTSVAATSLRAALAELGKAGGIAYENFKKISGVGFPEFISKGGTFQQALIMMKEHAAKTGTRFEDLFGAIEAVGAVSILAGKGAKTFADDLAAMNGSAGATGTAFEQMSTGMDHLKKGFESAKEVLLIGLGGALSEIAGPIFEKVNLSLKAAVDWFNSLSDSTRQTVVEIAATTTAFLALTSALLGLVGAATLFGITWSTVMVATGIGAIITAVGLLVVGIQQLISWVMSLDAVQKGLAANASTFATAWENVKIAVVAIWESIVEAASILMWGLADLLGTTTKDLSDGIDKSMAGAIDAFAGFVLEASRWIRVLAENIPTVWDLIVTTLELAVVRMKDQFMTLPYLVGDVMAMVGNVVKAAWDAIWSDEAVTDAVSNALNEGIARIAEGNVSDQQREMIAKRDALVKTLTDAKNKLKEDVNKAVPAAGPSGIVEGGAAMEIPERAKHPEYKVDYRRQEDEANWRSAPTPNKREEIQSTVSAMSGFIGFDQLAKQAQGKMDEVAIAKNQRDEQIRLAEEQKTILAKSQVDLGEIRMNTMGSAGLA